MTPYAMVAARGAVPLPPPTSGPGCEPVTDGFLAEPVSAVSSLAFVTAAVTVLVLHRRRADRSSTPPRPQPQRDRPAPLLGYAVLVAAVGVGSAVQHGPDPWWSDVAHDLPLLATLAFVGADAVADLSGRARVWWWWALPTAALLPVVVATPRAGDLAQAGIAVAAVALTLARARARPRARRHIGWAVGLLAVGAVIGTLSRAGGPLCVPDSIWQGHAAWHVLASAALVVLAPVIGHRGRAVMRPPTGAA